MMTRLNKKNEYVRKLRDRQKFAYEKKTKNISTEIAYSNKAVYNLNAIAAKVQI
jgi:hypothetical protein